MLTRVRFVSASAFVLMTAIAAFAQPGLHSSDLLKLRSVAGVQVSAPGPGGEAGVGGRGAEAAPPVGRRVVALFCPGPAPSESP